jgi:hypothetical protein
MTTAPYITAAKYTGIITLAAALPLLITIKVDALLLLFLGCLIGTLYSLTPLRGGLLAGLCACTLSYLTVVRPLNNWYEHTTTQLNQTQLLSELAEHPTTTKLLGFRLQADFPSIFTRLATPTMGEPLARNLGRTYSHNSIPSALFGSISDEIANATQSGQQIMEFLAGTPQQPPLEVMLQPSPLGDTVIISSLKPVPLTDPEKARLLYTNVKDWKSIYATHSHQPEAYSSLYAPTPSI